MDEAYWATNLDRVIREQGRKKKWIAERIGVHPSIMTLYTRRLRQVPPERAEAIAELLGVPLFLAFEVTERKKSGRPRKQAA